MIRYFFNVVRYIIDVIIYMYVSVFINLLKGNFVLIIFKVGYIFLKFKLVESAESMNVYVNNQIIRATFF